ncbi:4135_t:CDS:1, partial [Cetraspora pellucida]
VKPTNIEELSQYYEHSSQFLKSIFQKSYIDFPKQENENWQQPKLNSSLFYKNSKHEVFFDKQIPTLLFDKLASNAENSACNANN